MALYIFDDSNGNSITIPADTEDEANEELSVIAKFPSNFDLTEVTETEE
jgi:hypothetical protein